MPARTKPLRADAARNRDKLCAAATEVFREQGLDAPLERIARRAGVSIGTLYAHFPTRQVLFDAIIPVRLSAVDGLGEAALAEDDAWQGFESFVRGLLELQAQDRGLNDALAQRFPLSPLVSQACARGADYAERITVRAKAGGRLRADFGLADLTVLLRAVSCVIRESDSASPLDWRRCLDFLLDGLRAANRE